MTQEHIDSLWSQRGALAFQWLLGRGLTAEDIWEFQLGYDMAHDAVWIPYLVSGIEITGRMRILHGGNVKYLTPKGTKAHLYNVDDTAAAVVHLTEGEFDAMILRKLDLAAVGVPGATAFKKEWRWLFRDCDTVVLCFDADEAGERGANRIQAWIGDVCEDVRKLELPAGMDCNDAYLGGQLEGILHDSV